MVKFMPRKAFQSNFTVFNDYAVHTTSKSWIIMHLNEC